MEVHEFKKIIGLLICEEGRMQLELVMAVIGSKDHSFFKSSLSNFHKYVHDCTMCLYKFSKTNFFLAICYISGTIQLYAKDYFSRFQEKGVAGKFVVLK
jgi:hypothetical protein